MYGNINIESWAILTLKRNNLSMARFVDKAISIWVQLRDLYLFIFRHAIIVNAWLDDHTWIGINHRNWGDDINYYFIRELTGRSVISLFNFRLARRFRFKNFLCIGSLLGMPGYANDKTIVWGAGSFGELKGVVPKHICSVRGKLTRNILMKKGIECPEVYGDPALLLPLVYNPREMFKVQGSKFKYASSFLSQREAIHETRNQTLGPKGRFQSVAGKELETKRYRLGIIPHIDDLHHPVIEEIREKHVDEILIIDLAHYDKWTDVIDKICSCECILSSSLHGLIVSDAYQVPSCWIELSGKLIGGHYKFYDYASSVDRVFDSPFHIEKFADLANLNDHADLYFSCVDSNRLRDLQRCRHDRCIVSRSHASGGANVP